MKRLLRLLPVASLMLTLPAALPAQTKTVDYGRTTISTSYFLTYLASFGVTVTNLEGAPAVKTPTTFIVTEGAIDLTSGEGEITNADGYVFTGNGNTVRVQNLVLDSTTTSNTVMTALFIVNNKLVGRMPLYQVTAPATATLPLTPQAGTEEMGGLTLTLTKAAAKILNDAIIITEPVLQTGTAAGTADVYVVLSPTN